MTPFRMASSLSLLSLMCVWTGHLYVEALTRGGGLCVPTSGMRSMNLAKVTSVRGDCRQTNFSKSRAVTCSNTANTALFMSTAPRASTGSNRGPRARLTKLAGALRRVGSRRPRLRTLFRNSAKRLRGVHRRKLLAAIAACSVLSSVSFGSCERTEHLATLQSSPVTQTSLLTSTKNSLPVNRLEPSISSLPAFKGKPHTTRRHTPHARTSLHHVSNIITNTRAGGTAAKNTPASVLGAPSTQKTSVAAKGKAVKNTVEASARETTRTLREALQDLNEFMSGPKSDSLLLLLATALIPALCKKVGTSPILGFLAAGMVMGPNGLGWISGIHTTETLAELGIVFFLFEMGIELSVERLLSMKRDVFGLGLGQFACTALVVALIGGLAGLPANALVVLGGGLALSSSAFVLQLLKDQNQLATRFGRASFAVLLFQDLAVVPLLVVTPILAGSGSLANALSSAFIKATLALGSIAFAGRVLLNPLFATVAQAQSQEAFLGVVLFTALSMSFLTEGLGLSNTLGAFLAGVLLSETKYRYQVEADIAPFRGVLLGLFFVTVGFEIDLKLIASKFPLVSSIVLGIIAIKALVTTLLSMAFGLSLANAQQAGFILSQGGEFAFVAFGLARGLGILDPATTKLMLTCIALTMALTPFLVEVSGKIAQKFEEEADFSHYLGQDPEAIEIKESDDFVVLAGYGVVGRVVCELLDAKLVKYVGIEIDPNKAIQARNKGLPVFYGDIARPEVAEAFNVGRAKAVIITISDQDETNRAVISLRRQFPELKIFARAKDANHQMRLQKTLDVAAMVPFLPEDNTLLTLPFGGAVLKTLGAPAEQVNAILEAKRKEILSSKRLGESEEETILAQLGMPTTEEKEDSGKKPLPDIQMKEDSMVAQIIEANTSKKDDGEEKPSEDEQEVDEITDKTDLIIETQTEVLDSDEDNTDKGHKHVPQDDKPQDGADAEIVSVT